MRKYQSLPRCSAVMVGAVAMMGLGLLVTPTWASAATVPGAKVVTNAASIQVERRFADLRDYVVSKFPGDFAGSNIADSGVLELAFKASVPSPVVSRVKASGLSVKLVTNIGISEREKAADADTVAAELSRQSTTPLFTVDPGGPGEPISVTYSPDALSDRAVQAILTRSVSRPESRVRKARHATRAAKRLAANRHAMQVSEAIQKGIAADPKLDAVVLDVVIDTVEPGTATATTVYGGNALNDSKGQRYCTSGYSVIYQKRAGILTAGHCTAVAKYGSAGLKKAVGYFNASGDFSVWWPAASSGVSFSHKFQYKPGKYSTVKKNHSVGVGQGVCKYGTSTGFSCARVLGINMHAPFKDPVSGRIFQMSGLTILQGKITSEGDSGGPAFEYSDYSTAVGIVSGYNRDYDGGYQCWGQVTMIQPTAYLSRWGITLGVG